MPLENDFGEEREKVAKGWRLTGRGPGTFIIVGCLGVVVLALAVSSRVDEYQAFSGFAGAEETEISQKLMSGRGSNLFVSSAEGLRGQLRALRPLQGLEGEDGEEAEGQEAEEEDKPLTPEQVDVKAKEWAAEHPSEARRLNQDLGIGLVIIVLGMAVFLYSEIQAVLTVRDLDVQAWTGDHLDPDLEERASRWAGGMGASLRPWFSLAGLVLQFLGGMVMLVPMCALLAEFGLPEAANSFDCITSMTFTCLLSVIALNTLLTSLCWSCTRPWAAMLLASISLGANVALNLKSPFFTVIWAVLSGLLAFYYFQYIPESMEGYHPRPVDWFTPLNSQPAAHYRGRPQSRSGTTAMV